MSTPQPPIDPADPLGLHPLGAPVPADTPDPLTADHVPQHALGEPVIPPGERWPEATLASTPAAAAEMDNAALAGVAADLTAHVGQLAIALTAERAAREAALAAEAEARSKDRRSVVTWLRRGGGFIAFDVVVTVAGLVAGILLYGVVGTVEKQQAQTCYFYRLVVNNYDPAGPARRAYKAGTLAYDQAYQGMYDGATLLSCAGVKRPDFPVPLGAPIAAPAPVVPVVPVVPTPVPTPLPTPVRVR